jgi:hypothetical protein
MLKFFSGLVVLLLALFLQFQFVAAGFHVIPAFAVLIAFAFIFDFLELLFFDLLAIFIINWQPAPSVALIAFAIIPLVAYSLRRIFHAEPWLGVIVAIFFGFLIFYLIASPSFIFHNFTAVLLDIVIGFGVGELVFAGLH